MEKYNLNVDGVHVFEDSGNVFIEDAQERIEWDGDFYSACKEAER